MKKELLHCDAVCTTKHVSAYVAVCNDMEFDTKIHLIHFLLSNGGFNPQLENCHALSPCKCQSIAWTYMTLYENRKHVFI